MIDFPFIGCTASEMHCHSLAGANGLPIFFLVGGHG